MKLKFFFAIALIALLVIAGSAAAQGAHQVVLSWTASASTGVTGYNVYRLTAACPTSINLSTFTKLTSSPITATTYTDTAVTTGSTYCYAATAVAPGGESGANGTLQVAIPVFTASAIPGPPGAFGSPTVQ